MPFDFNSMVDVEEKANTPVVATSKFDFSTMEDTPEAEAPVKEKRGSIFSKVARSFFKGSILEQFETLSYIKENEPEDDDDYFKNVEALITKREKGIIEEGIGRQLKYPIAGAIATGAVAHPLTTVGFLGGFELLDKFVNLRRFTEKRFPNTAPEVKDIVEIADFMLKGGLIAKTMSKGKAYYRKMSKTLNAPKNVNVSPSNVKNVKESINLLPEEKTDMMRTLGMEKKHVDASLKADIPINVASEKIIDLTAKPYWERARADLLAKEAKPVVAKPSAKAIEFEVKWRKLYSQEMITKIKSLQKGKKLSGLTVSKLKKFLGIEKLKKAELPQLEKLTKFMEQLKEGDKFLSEKQVTGLRGILKDLPVPEITPKRIVIDKFGDKEQILGKGIVGKVVTELMPTVDIKEGHPLVKKLVNKIGEKLAFADKEISRRDLQLEKMLTIAEKERIALLPKAERISRRLVPQNKEVFQALSGEPVKLTKGEGATVAYLKNFFKKAREDLKLEKYRKNYVTHLEKDLTEKVLEKGIFEAVKDIFKKPKERDIPTDIMLELDNIIGSEKFFKFAMERKGGIDPTTNLRTILHQYSKIYETKKVLDSILPEGQAITQLLLKGKSAVWMKKFLQNLKGRGLDTDFRHGKMGWLAKTADGIIDLGYLKLLGLNWRSALKNIVAGETNSWIYQDFKTYMTGKKRFLSNPKRAYKLASESGALDGTYAEYAQKGIGKFKKVQDLAMVGQKAGEVEIRSSIFASMLSEKEWKSGKVEPKTIQAIKDTIAMTQGMFSKTDSPLLLQTWYGRMFFQMNRWRITNAMMLRRITTGAVKDMKAGKFKTQNVTKMAKMVSAYGAGMYLSYELSKAGLRRASRIAASMAEVINGTLSLVTEGDLIRMFTDNPTLSFVKEAFFSAQELANYLRVPGVQKPRELEFRKGLEKTYIAPLETIKDIVE